MPCIGEQLKEREANKTDEVCFNQMKAIAGTVPRLIVTRRVATGGIGGRALSVAGGAPPPMKILL